MIWPLSKNQTAMEIASPQYRAALDAFPRPVWLRAADLSLAWVNAAYAHALGQPASSIIKQQVELLRHANDSDGRSLARQAKEKHAPATALRHVVIGGERRLLLVTEESLGGGFFGFALDQTKTEELESELTRTRNAEAQVLQNIATAVAIFGADQKLNFYNPSFVLLTHLTPSQLDAQPTLAQVANAMRDVARLPEYPDFRRARETWQAWFTNLIAPHEELLHLPDNTTLHLQVMPHPSGGLLLMLEDITDRLALEAAYNTQIAVQRETLDNLREGTVLLGGDGRVRLWNPAFLSIWNLADSDLQNRPHWRGVSDLFAKRFTPPAWESACDTLVTAPLSHSKIEHTYTLADGCVIEYAAQPLPDGAILLRFLDVTDKTKLTAALQDRADALAAADRLKSEFLYNVSYQLRTPLNTITGFAEILKLPAYGPLTDRQADYVQHILEATDTLVSLIDNLLALSSIQAGQIEIVRAITDIHALLLEVADFSGSLALAAHLKLVVEADAAIGSAMMDAARVKQVLLNLISNALKFAPNGSNITLGARREIRDAKNGVLLWVRDEGPGIASEDHVRVFAPFERTHRKGAGAGLGLSLVKSIIQLHDGDVRLVSADGAGTEVQCWIPV